jgi:hypothetical protein
MLAASWLGCGVIVVTSLAIPVRAQTPVAGTDARRPLDVATTVSLADVGWDDNVFRANKADGPVGDFTATFRPTAQLSLNRSRLKLASQGEVDFIYFRELADVRSIDANATSRVEAPMGRVTPYVGGSWASARHRRNFEIDSPIRRVEATGEAGVDVRLSPRISTGVMTRWSKVDYAGDTIYLDTDLSVYLGASAVGHGVRMQYTLTPLTTIGVEVQRDRAKFASANERNSNGYRVMSVIELRPFALISGRAQVGVRRRSFDDGSVSPFHGTIARADVAYTLLGRTRMGVSVQRDLSSSYRADQRDYLQTGVDVSITHRLGNRWDVGGGVGRYHLTYGAGETPATPGLISEQVTQYSFSFGYQLERIRVGGQFARQGRSSGFSANREYEETRIGSTVTYGF